MNISTKIDHFRDHYGIPASTLKWIAIITMFIDHTGATLLRRLMNAEGYFADPSVHEMMSQLYYYSRRIGRLAFPIFCFLLVEGYFHTRSPRKYLTRMFLFALLSEFPFDWALHPKGKVLTKQNVYFTLFLGLLAIHMSHDILKGKLSLQLMILASAMLAAKLLGTDYSYRGVFLIETLYITRFSRFFQCGCGAAFVEYERMPTPLAFVPCFLYNGKRGRQPKYFFYFFYPAHLLLLGAFCNLVLPHLL